MRAKNEWGLGSPRPKPPLTFPTQLFLFSRLSGSLEQTQLKYDAESRNRTRATLVGGECSHHCATPAIHIKIHASSIFQEHRSLLTEIEEMNSDVSFLDMVAFVFVKRCRQSVWSKRLTNKIREVRFAMEM